MISQQESYTIRYVRSISMLFIVLCHLQQAYGSKWAWLFNVGVQSFLTISGFLSGRKNVSNWKTWYLNKIEKLYPPYIIYVFLSFIIYKFFGLYTFTYNKLLIYIMDLQWILGGVKGLTHLWFMTAIALCYLITPILQFLRKKDKYSIGLLLLIVLGLLNIFVIPIFLDLFSSLFVYSYSYLYACLDKKRRKGYILFLLCSFILTLFFLDWDVLLNYDNGINKWFHIVLGLLIVLTPICVVNRLNIQFKEVPLLIRRFDEYSYYVYITHHIFILGPLSIAFVFASPSINILLISILTIVSAIILKFLSDRSIYYINCKL